MYGMGKELREELSTQHSLCSSMKPSRREQAAAPPTPGSKSFLTLTQPTQTDANRRTLPSHFPIRRALAMPATRLSIHQLLRLHSRLLPLFIWPMVMVLSATAGATPPRLVMLTGPNAMETQEGKKVQWLENRESEWLIENPGPATLAYLTFLPQFGPELFGRDLATLVVRSGEWENSLAIKNRELAAFTVPLQPGANRLALSILEPGTSPASRPDRRNLLVLATGPEITTQAAWSASAPLGLGGRGAQDEFRWLGGANEVVLNAFTPASGKAVLNFSAFRGPLAPAGLCLVQVQLPNGRTLAFDAPDGPVPAIELNVPAGHSVIRVRCLAKPTAATAGSDRRPLVVMIRALNLSLPAQ